MEVAIGQVYIRPGVNFPFSFRMQVWLSKKLTSAATKADAFEKKYGAGFSLMINLSAKTQISANEIKGPAVFKKDKDVEYTLFLPFDVIRAAEESRQAAAEYLLTGIHSIFEKVGIDTIKLDKKKTSIIDNLCSDPTMLHGPWPHH